MRLVVYLDLLLIINLIMNLLIVWATAKLAEIDYNFWRLLLASLAGTVYTIMIVLPGFAYLNRMVFHFLISIIMILVAFAPLKRDYFMKVLGYFYLITFVTAGAILALYNLTEGSPLESLAQVLNISPDNLWIIIMGFLIIIIIGKFGWMLIQQSLLPGAFCVPIIIKFNDSFLKVKALVDTGNQLEDPLTRVPVIVIEIEAMVDILPAQIRESFHKEKLDFTNILDEMTDTSWSNRFRIIPFSSLGNENGMLVGFRPDKVTVVTKEEIFTTKRVIIALQDQKFDKDNSYQALLNPGIFKG